jgi:hypothetical protein
MLGFVPPVAADEPYLSSAAERIKVSLGGYYQQWAVGLRQSVADGPDDVAPGGVANTIKINPVDNKHNSEICFIGQTTLDNGLTVGINVQLEGNTEGDQFDESYVFLQGPALGQFIIGDENNAGYLLHVWPTNGGISLDEGDLCNMEAFVNTGGIFFDAPLCTTNLRMADGDSGKFTYITPRFAGLQAGVSFIPQTEPAGGDDNNGAYFVRNAAPNAAGTQVAVARSRYANGWSGGLNYAQEFEGFAIDASLGTMWFPRSQQRPIGKNGSDLFMYNAGLQLTVGGFAISGAYLKVPNKYTVDRTILNAGGVAGQSTTLSNGGYCWAAGASYEFGPYKVGVDYMYGQGYGVVSATGALAQSTGNDQSLQQAVVSGTWTMGPGIRLVGGVFGFDLQTDTPGFTGYNSKGIGATTGVKLAF